MPPSSIVNPPSTRPPPPITAYTISSVRRVWNPVRPSKQHSKSKKKTRRTPYPPPPQPTPPPSPYRLNSITSPLFTHPKPKFADRQAVYVKGPDTLVTENPTKMIVEYAIQHDTDLTWQYRIREPGYFGLREWGTRREEELEAWDEVWDQGGKWMGLRGLCRRRKGEEW